MRTSMLALVLLHGGCATAPRLVPPPSATTRDFVNGTDFMLVEPLAYSIGNSGEIITVPRGFVTDFASIPSALQLVVRKLGNHNRPAVVHDYLYWSQTCTRDQADNLLMIAMKEMKVKKSRRWKIYQGVHLAGQAAWNGNRRQLAEGWPKIVPPTRFELTDTHSWRQARAILRQEGVRDPQFPNGAAFCALGNSQDVPGGNKQAR